MVHTLKPGLLLCVLLTDSASKIIYNPAPKFPMPAVPSHTSPKEVFLMEHYPVNYQRRYPGRRVPNESMPSM